MNFKVLTLALLTSLACFGEQNKEIVSIQGEYFKLYEKVDVAFEKKNLHERASGSAATAKCKA